jgi:anti-sigma factor RsiW
MSVTDHDLETLEGYLDDALNLADVESLRARLASDEGLVAALGQIRAQRAARQALFRAIEPDAAATDALLCRIRTDVARETRRSLVPVPARYAAAAAACLAIGFFVRGWLDHRPPAPMNASSDKSHVDLRPVAAYQVTLRDDNGKVVAVQRFDSFEKAQEFAADLARWQSRSERLAGGRFVLTADRF